MMVRSGINLNVVRVSSCFLLASFVSMSILSTASADIWSPFLVESLQTQNRAHQSQRRPDVQKSYMEKFLEDLRLRHATGDSANGLQYGSATEPSQEPRSNATKDESRKRLANIFGRTMFMLNGSRGSKSRVPSSWTKSDLSEDFTEK